MDRFEPALAYAWQAELALDFERRGARTVLAGRRHRGPLVVQKPLYPEGESVCHAIVVHPPAGIAGGDRLDVAVAARDGAHALLTTPGAAKWYRSAGPWACQSTVLEAGAGACVEWLPQETILYSGALARIDTRVVLAPGACLLGWEILCLGRTASGERYERGACRLATSVYRGERLLWREAGRIGGDAAYARSAPALGGATVTATLYAVDERLDAQALAACREIAPEAGEAGVTLLPGVLLARCVGDSAEAAKRYFAALWAVLRPLMTQRAAVAPRIWST